MRTDFRLGFYKSYTIAFCLVFLMTATNHFLCSYLLLPFLLSFCFYLSWCLCLLSVTTKDTRYYKLIYSMFHAIAKRKAKYPYGVPHTGRTQKLWNVWNCVGLIMVKKKPKGLFDGQLYVFACDQNRRGEAEIETNTRPNQSNVVFGPMKRKKGSVLSGNDGYKGEGYGWKSLGLFIVVTGNLNPFA